jgi:hypothetical protein
VRLGGGMAAVESRKGEKTSKKTSTGKNLTLSYLLQNRVRAGLNSNWHWVNIYGPYLFIILF